MLDADAFTPGVYQLVFRAGDYFRAQLDELPEPPFVDEVVLRFGIADGDAPRAVREPAQLRASFAAWRVAGWLTLAVTAMAKSLPTGCLQSTSSRRKTVS